MAVPTSEELLELIKTDVQKFNEARKANPSLAIDFSGADLRKANLRQAELGRANLSGADLRETDLTDAQLNNANLEGADLRGATVDATNLHRAKILGAKLQGARLGDFAKDGLRICLHPSSFEDVEYGKEHV